MAARLFLERNWHGAVHWEAIWDNLTAVMVSVLNRKDTTWLRAVREVKQSRREDGCDLTQARTCDDIVRLMGMEP